jgi:large conductance mechanosensitive channel
VLKELKDFLMQGNIVSLAVAVVIGVAFAALVDSLVANIITPIIAAIIGQPDFSDLTFTINGSVFKYGSFINALISFLSIAIAVFFFVVKPLNKLNEMRGIDPADERSDETKVLEEIRDLLGKQQG